MRRAAGAGVAVLALSGLAPAAATAVEIPPEVESGTGGLTIQDLGTVDEVVTVGLEVVAGKQRYVVVSLHGLTARQGCEAPSKVARGARTTCDRVTPSVFASFDLGDDTVTMDAALPDPVVAVGGRGNDRLTGGGRADRLRGGQGNDSLRGNGGDDELFGERDDDSLSGGTGDDDLGGDVGADELVGDLGNDNLDGGADADAISDGSESATAGTSDDEVDAGSGNDLVQAGLGDDVVQAGTGDDVITDLGSRFERDQFNGEEGRDRLRHPVAGVFGLTIVLPGGAQSGEPDTLANLEEAEGSEGPDRLRVADGQTGAFTLIGGANRDSLEGGGGPDLLAGGEGDDTLFSFAGDDVIDAKAGEAKATRELNINCGAGTDLAIVDLIDPEDLRLEGCENIDRSAIGEGPHVGLGVARRLALRNGALAVALSCPRRLRHACRGTLGAARTRAGLARAPRTAYSLRAGTRRTVLVRAGAGVRRGGQAVLRSRERGDIKGIKTTLRAARVA